MIKVFYGERGSGKTKRRRDVAGKYYGTNGRNRPRICGTR